MTIKRGVSAAILTAGVLTAGATPAHAIPPPPPGGDLLIVYSYYSGEQVIGQRWFGCSKPPGQWGDVTGMPKVFFTPC
ncbi:hypothetical protein ABGB18_26895 [Nonomuraea sp. B12E4]|uniref:hypothetical protein n=1 Tax=Nonomuraea sp. B12E4 TaxID=3153564 RepID=UPI00325F69A6